MCEHCGCNTLSHHDHADGSDMHENHVGHSHETHGRRSIEIQADLLAHNRSHADAVRRFLEARGSRLVNIIGSPGCGKTELLAALIPLLDANTVVIEGDLATRNDADRIEKSGAPVYQIETGTACHLDAHEIEHALSHLPIVEETLVLVENVGNLVCPSMFDVGESLRLVCLSVTEGVDKPEKYPISFREANVAVITKADLLPYVDFDLERCRRLIEAVHPDMPVIVTSAKETQSLKPLIEMLTGLWKR